MRNNQVFSVVSPPAPTDRNETLEQIGGEGDVSKMRHSAGVVRSHTGNVFSREFRIVSALALVWYFSSLFFPLQVSIAGRNVAINAGAGAYLVPLFGVYLYRKESDPYQRKRILWIVGLYLLLWVYFLGRRADCGWCCPCVASRETFAAAVRDKTRKGGAWWSLRHLKWINVAMVLLYLAAVAAIGAGRRNLREAPLRLSSRFLLPELPLHPLDRQPQFLPLGLPVGRHLGDNRILRFLPAESRSRAVHRMRHLRESLRHGDSGGPVHQEKGRVRAYPRVHGVRPLYHRLP